MEKWMRKSSARLLGQPVVGGPRPWGCVCVRPCPALLHRNDMCCGGLFVDSAHTMWRFGSSDGHPDILLWRSVDWLAACPGSHMAGSPQRWKQGRAGQAVQRMPGW